MIERFCLRCDWTGETDVPACPRCGAPLYLLGHPEPARPRGNVARSEPEAAGLAASREPVEEAWDDRDVDEVAVASGGRWRVIVLALVLAAAGFALALIRAAGPDARRAAVLEELGAPPAIFPSLSPAPASPPPPPGQCSAPASPPVLTPAETLPGAAADYRFQGSFGSEGGTAPALTAVGKGATAFTDEGMIGRTVLSFPGRTGLLLSATAGLIPSTEYTIEILLRFDHVRGYRKVIDFRDGSDDNGLYVSDGCLTFYPRPVESSTPIEADSYVQVVLTRGASDTVVGYVDGIRQFAFDDRLGIAEIGPEGTLRFLVDDARTRIESSSGAVSQVRLYDRPLTANEVAALACVEIRVPIDAASCPSAEG